MKNIYLLPTLLAEGTSADVLPVGLIDRIQSLDIFFVENIKSARRFITALKIGKVIDELRFILLDKDSSFEEVYEQMLALDGDAGVLSEAGCPGIADPGSMAVEVAHQLSYKVIPMVGPSSIFLALMASGFNGQSFAFNGYLPIDKKERNQKIKELDRLVFSTGQTQIFIETPYRNIQLFEALLEYCHPSTKLHLSVNLTAADAFSVTKSISAWKSQKTPEMHKVPAIFCLGR